MTDVGFHKLMLHRHKLSEPGINLKMTGGVAHKDGYQDKSDNDKDTMAKNQGLGSGNDTR